MVRIQSEGGRRGRRALLAAATAFTLGCRGTTEADTRNPRIDVRVGPASAAVQPLTLGGHTLVLQGARLSARTVEIVSTHDAAGHDCRNDVDGTCLEYESGPFVVELPLAGGSAAGTTNEVPPGVYGGAEVDLAELRVQGTYDGSAFDVPLSFDREVNLSLRAPLEMPRGRTFTFLVATEARSWFVSADGTSLIDPRTLPASDVQRAAVRQKVLASFALEASLLPR